ncbi:TonB-dependent receptor [candidate division KSB1 bacterium]|nr:TonB-dependent receptor [candidate division KSB1 bacterium]
MSLHLSPFCLKICNSIYHLAEQRNKMNFGVIFVIFILVHFSSGNAAVVHGFVLNEFDHTPLPNANIVLLNSAFGTTAQQDGAFVLTNLPVGKLTLQVSHIGFATQQLTIDVKEDEIANVTILLQPQPVVVDEIYLTSTRYRRTWQDLSMPMSSVSDRKIEQTMPRDVSEAVNREPGLSITRDGVWGTHVNIRGLSRNNVVMLVDGTRIDTANDLAAGLSMIDVNDVERIEVIKGAASSLYGSGAIGGVIAVHTKEGHYADNPYLHANLTSGYSSVNNSSQGYFNLTGGAAAWHARIAGTLRSSADAQTPTGVLKNSGYRDSNIAAQVAVKPFDKHEFRMNWQRYRGLDIGIPGGNMVFPGNADVRYPRVDRDLLDVEYIVRHLTPSLAAITLKYFSQDILRDVDNQPHIVTPMPGAPARIANVQHIKPLATHAIDGALLQTDLLFWRQHVVAGIDVWQKQLDSFRERFVRVDVLNGEGAVVNSIQQVTGERPIPLSTYRSAGLFLQDEAPMVKNRLVLTVGGRYDFIQVENEEALQPVYLIVDGAKNDNPPNQKVLWEAQTADNRSWSGNIGLLVKATERTDVTLTVARSFRSPYLEERYQYIDQGNLVKIGNPNLQPEKGAFADVGLRHRGEKVTFIGNLFYNRIKDMVVETAGEYEGRNALLKTNIGSAELYGFDASLDLALYRSIHLFGGAAYVHGTDTFVNEPLPLVPPLNGRLGVRSALTSCFTLECAAHLFGGQDRIAEWEKETPGYAVFDLYLTSAAFSLGDINNQFFLGIENLFDRACRNHLSTNRGSITMEPGRNISLRWRIGI